MQTIMETIRCGGNVLIPCDSSGRVLELLRVLDQYWIQNKYVHLIHSFFFEMNIEMNIEY